MVFTLYKKEGETPLQCLERFRDSKPELLKEKMTYAGRLDPMAEGVLVVLSGEDIKRKEEFLNLDKDYEFEVLWGASSDSFDILGMPNIGKAVSEDDISKAINSLPNELSLPYPSFSSKTIKGKPLFDWFRKGRIEEIEVPEREMRILNIEHLDNRNVSSQEILKNIIYRIERVEGDFRQEEIIRRWEEVIRLNWNLDFQISRFKTTVTSGTYIRSIADLLGKNAGSGALAWSIKRTRVGNYT